MKKRTYKFISLLLSILFVASAVSGIHMYRELNAEKLARADANLYNWSRILEISKKIQQVDDVEHAKDIFHLQNGIIYTIDGNELSPNFDNLEAPTTKQHFLNIYFNDFMHMLSLAEGTEPDLEERFALLHKIGEELEEICTGVLGYGDKGNAQKLELMDKGSDIYNKTQKEINDFCNEYIEEIRKYN